MDSLNLTFSLAFFLVAMDIVTSLVFMLPMLTNLDLDIE